MSDVVDGIVYITDIGKFGAMNEGYRTIFTKDYPARATVGTGLVNADGLVEIMFVARNSRAGLHEHRGASGQTAAPLC